MSETEERVKKIDLAIEDAFMLVHERSADKCGFFQELYNYETEENGMIRPYQVDWCYSGLNVIRGLYLAPWYKFVTCLQGQIFGVIADLRRTSKTFLQCTTYTLKANEPNSVFVPSGCAHGYLGLVVGGVHVVSLLEDTYKEELEKRINYADPDLKIKWPAVSGGYILSEKDQAAPTVKQLFNNMD